MKTLPDRAILLFCCLLLQAWGEIGSMEITAFLCCIILQTVMLSAEKRRTWAFPGLSYLTAAFFIPAFRPYLPLLCYEAFGKRDLLLLVNVIPSLLLLAGVTSKGVPYAAPAALALTGLAFLLEERTRKLDEMEAKYRNLRDENMEWKLSTERRTKELMEKQDYEIHVAMLEERSRIAREIHDHVGHMLSRSLIQIGALHLLGEQVEKQAEKGLPKASDSETAAGRLNQGLSELERTLDDAMDNIRASVHDLHEEAFDLLTSLRQVTEAFSFCPCTLEYDVEERMDRRLKYMLLAVVKEALSNVMKHSRATRATVILREHPALYQLIVEDNGIGKREDADRSGIGFATMRERVEAFGGSLEMGQGQAGGQGFRIFVRIPKAADSGGR